MGRTINWSQRDSVHAWRGRYRGGAAEDYCIYLDTEVIRCWHKSDMSPGSCEAIMTRRPSSVSTRVQVLFGLSVIVQGLILDQDHFIIIQLLANVPHNIHSHSPNTTSLPLYFDDID